MASEFQQPDQDYDFQQNTLELFVAIDVNAERRGICLKDAIEAIGLSPETVEAMQKGDPISQDDSIEILEWLKSEEVDPDMHRMHVDTNNAVVELLGGVGAKEARGFVN